LQAASRRAAAGRAGQKKHDARANTAALELYRNRLELSS